MKFYYCKKIHILIVKLKDILDYIYYLNIQLPLGMVGQAAARRAAGVVVEMVKEGEYHFH